MRPLLKVEGSPGSPFYFVGSGSKVQNLASQIKAQEMRMEKLVSVYLDGEVSKQIYLTKKDDIMRASASLQAKLKAFERGKKNWVEPLRAWILDTKQADFLAKSDNLHEIKAFVQKIGTNPRVRDKSALFEFPPPSHFAAKRRGKLSRAVMGARRASALSLREVAICGAFGLSARTYQSL